MAAPNLIAYGRAVSTPFGLLGATENALTFALGYTFQKCPALLRRFLRDVGIARVRSELLSSTRIYLQRTSTAAGRNITNIELHLPGQAHVIVEAKIGLSVPSLKQCLKYLPRFQKTGEPQRKLVALVESPATDFIRQYQHERAGLRSLLVGYQWARLIPHCVRLQAHYAADAESGQWVRAFRTFLEEEYAMKCFTEEVWIVPAQSKPLWPGGWSFYPKHRLVATPR